MKIFSSTSDKSLTEKICQKLIQNRMMFGFSGQPIGIGELQIDKFSDGEILPMFKESVRDEDVYFVSSTNTSDSIIEALLVIDAAKRSGCKSFTLISPYSGYSRQDKVDHTRSSIGSRMLADILEKVGISKMITIDLHNSCITGFYSLPIIHLNGNKIFIDYIKSLELTDICILAPDSGAVKRTSDFYKAFPDSSFAMINKKRIKPGEIHSMEIVGNCEGKNVIIVDDMIDSGKTIAKATDLILQHGGKSVRCVCTHGVLSGEAIKTINDSKISELIISDTISSVYTKSELSEKIKIISCADIIASSIIAISKKISINELNQI